MTAGVIPRALRDLFEQLEKVRQQCVSNKENQPQDSDDDDDSTTYEYEVRVQFLELYGEDIRDLLTPSSSERLTIRDVGLDDEPEVLGATKHKVESAEDALLCLSRGMMRRVTGATAMNASSSRSHAILSVLVEQTTTLEEPQCGNGGQIRGMQHVQVKRSKFNFVDLAGSERQKRTQAEGQRLKEGIDINKGLLVLGNVISALGDPKKVGKSFVPYRDSKLTRLLKGKQG
jgi:kinesin family protein 4/21/27